MGMRTEDNVHVIGMLRRGKVVWRFILRKKRDNFGDIFAKIITTGVRTEDNVRVGELRY